MNSGYVGEASRFREQTGRGDTVAIDEDKIQRWADALHNMRNADRLAYWTEYRNVPHEFLRDLQIGWDNRRRRYTIPVRDSLGRCVDVKLYRPGEKEFGKSLHYTEKHRQPDGSMKPEGWGKPPRLWGLERVAAAQPGKGRAGVVVVCAGEPDAIVATALGYLAVSPTSGEGSLCRKQDIDVLLKAVEGGWPIRLLFDVDIAGRAAAGVWGRALVAAGFTNVKDVELQFPNGDGKDLTDWVVNDEWSRTGNFADAGTALWAAIRAASKLAASGVDGGNDDSGATGSNAKGRAGKNRAGKTADGDGDGDSSDPEGDADGDGDSSGRRPIAELMDMAITVKLAEYGSRNRAGFWLWCQLRDERYAKGEATGFLGEWVDRVNSAAGAKAGHPYTVEESRLSLDEAYSVAPRDANGKGLNYPLTDMGNAERFVARHGADIAWVPAWDGWAVWDGRKWDATGVGHSQVVNWSHTVPRMMYEEGIKLARKAKAMPKGKDEDEPDPKATEAQKSAAKLMAWARVSESAGKLSAIVSLSRSKVTVPAEQFDTDGALLNCSNGVLDLRAKVSFRPHSRDDRLTLSVNTAFSPIAECSEFDRFLKEILPDEEVRGYLQRLVGYSLIGGNPARKFIIVHGPSASGKSTLSNILQGVLGKYAQPFKLSLMREKQDEGPRPDILNLLPARMIFASEASDAWYLHADQVKHMTGDEPITARGMHAKAYVTRYPAFTPWLLTNGIPQIKGADAALWRRLIALPFEVSREAGTEDLGLGERIIRMEGAGVLRWAVDGYIDWREKGLDDMPSAVAVHTMRVREELTDLDQWLAECTEGGSEYSEYTEVLFENYRTWCMANHINERDQMTLRGFGKHLQSRGYESGPRTRPEGAGRNASAKRTRQGIRLRITKEEDAH